MRIVIRARLSELLKERGMSRLSGVPQGSISRFDRNSRHESAHLFAIAGALGVRIEDLFDVEETGQQT